MPLPEGAKIIGNKWVFRAKLKVDRNSKMNKSRVVAKRYDQTLSIDGTKIFSLIVKSFTIRVVLTQALLKGWTVRKFDLAMPSSMINC